jgi:hypothetical protein
MAQCSHYFHTSYTIITLLSAVDVHLILAESEWVTMAPECMGDLCCHIGLHRLRTQEPQSHFTCSQLRASHRSGSQPAYGPAVGPVVGAAEAAPPAPPSPGHAPATYSPVALHPTHTGHLEIIVVPALFVGPLLPHQPLQSIVRDVLPHHMLSR